MKIIPYTSGRLRLEISKNQLIGFIKKTSIENMSPMNSNDHIERNLYGSWIYENRFFVWKVPDSIQRFIYTTLHCRVKELEDRIELKWHVRFNFFTNVLMLALVALSIYLIFYNLNENSGNFKDWIIALFPYPLFILVFNYYLKDSLEFLNKIENTFANSGHKANSSDSVNLKRNATNKR